MKKLNRKGFTLVELLAVIIILAIVVGIAIPSITAIINGSKNSALGVAVDSAADYLKEQFDIYNLDANMSDEAFNNSIAGTYGSSTLGNVVTITSSNDLFKAMGFDANKVTEVDVCVAADGDVYVQVTEIPVGTSDYYTTDHWNADGTFKSTSDVKNTFSGNGAATVSGTGSSRTCS